SGTFSGTDGVDAVVKAGTGTLTLSGTINTYRGGVAVSAGTLLFNGSLTSGTAAVTVNGGTLGGSGNLVRPVTVSSGGTVAPGSSPGILSTGNVAFASGSTFAAELNSPYATAGTDYDQLNVTGSVDLGGATFSLAGGGRTPAAGRGGDALN